MQVLVDTNVLLRVVEPGHAQHTTAVTALRRLRQAGEILCIVPQVHYEFWVVATRPIAVRGLGMSTTDALQELDRLGPPLFRLLRDERAIYDTWRNLMQTQPTLGKKAHDARLVAAAMRHAMGAILTFNASDFHFFQGLVVLDPLRV